jgi:hypothetical protein
LNFELTKTKMTSIRRATGLWFEQDTTSYFLNMTQTHHLRLIHTRHATPIPFPCHSPVMPCHVNSHMPCYAPAILWKCCVLHESLHGSQKYLNCQSYSWTDWCASDNKPLWNSTWQPKEAERGQVTHMPSLDGHANSQMSCHAMPMPRCAVALRSCFQNSMVVAWHRHCMCAAWHVWIKCGHTV